MPHTIDPTPTAVTDLALGDIVDISHLSAADLVSFNGVAWHYRSNVGYFTDRPHTVEDDGRVRLHLDAGDVLVDKDTVFTVVGHDERVKA